MKHVDLSTESGEAVPQFVEKRTTLTLKDGNRRSNFPPFNLVVKTPSPRATKGRQPRIICIERKGWIVPASWSSCGSSPTVVPSRRGGVKNWGVYPSD